MSYHEPVLLPEVVDALQIEKGKRYIDATFGGGGHTRAFLEQGAVVLGIDTDPDAIQEAKLLKDKDFTIAQGNFRDIEDIARVHTFYPVDGILLDLGVSSHQLDAHYRGFSYRYADAPMDLRLNQQQGASATEIINHATEEELIHIIEAFGEEESGRIIARALCNTRQVKPITTTHDVYRCIEEIVGKKRAKETASRVFQAFRIAVNDELQALQKGLEGSAHIVTNGGRLCVISYHSLEDRIVKRFFSDTQRWKVITKKPVTPSEKEQERNRRSRSAKLRVAEKI